MESQCAHCSEYAPKKWSGLQILGNEKTSVAQERINKFLQGYELIVNLGAGRQESCKLDEANKIYLSRHFPSMDKEVYCCPPVYEYRYPGEPSKVISEKDGESLSLTGNIKYYTLKRNRLGELAEEEVIVKLRAMLKKSKMASFIIHGYNWKTKYMNTILKLSPTFRKLFKDLSLEQGEIDFLISIPGKCMMTIEVKAADDPCTITPVVLKAFSKQSEKTGKFLSLVSFDLVGGTNIPLIKVVALPNFHKQDVEKLYCGLCSSHIMNKQDLDTSDSLYAWFQNITKMYSAEIENSQLDIRLHEKLVGRLIGPTSLVEVRTIPESIQKTVSQITEEHGTSQKIQERWYQFNPEQLSVKFNDPKVLWLTGEPGSGKTVLALWKIQEILRSAGDVDNPGLGEGETLPLLSRIVCPEDKPRKQHQFIDSTASDRKATPKTSQQQKSAVSAHQQKHKKTGTKSNSPSNLKNTSSHHVHSEHTEERHSVGNKPPALKANGSVLYLLAGINALCLLQTFKQRLQKVQHGTCELIVTTVEELSETEDYNLKLNKFLECQDLPQFIRFLQERHPGKTVHVIMDEASWFLNRVDLQRFKDDWERVIEHERAGYIWIIQDTGCIEWDSTVILPQFHAFHLSHIMRMSKQNVEFANLLLDKDFQSGHAVTGNYPLIYTMDCICLQQQENNCFFCHGVRVAWLLRQALVDIEITNENNNNEELGLKDIALLSRNFEGISALLKLFKPPVSFVLKKYPDAGSNEMTVCAVGDFQGCEQSIIFTDFDTGACAEGTSKECLTRTLGQLIILDGGCNPAVARDYTDQMGKVEIEAYTGNVALDIKEVIPTAEDMRMLRGILISHLSNQLTVVESDIKKVMMAESSKDLQSLNIKRYKEQKNEILKQRDELNLWLENQ